MMDENEEDIQGHALIKVWPMSRTDYNALVEELEYDMLDGKLWHARFVPKKAKP